MTIDTTSYSEEVLEQASAWIVRLRSDHATEQDQQDFALWLAESSDHQQAFDEMMVLWEAMGTGLNPTDDQAAITALLGKVSADNGPKASNDCQSENATKLTSSTVSHLAAKPYPLVASFAAMAASLLFVALVLFASNPSINETLELQRTLYATPIGKQQRFTLDDGSFIELNTDSKVAVIYEDDLRGLELIQGEAYFDVVPNPERPFVVTAGAGTVTAVGTAFNIQLSSGFAPDGTMLVAVTEGHVAVTNTSSGHDETVPVALGQQARVNELGQVGPVEAADLTLVSAWREKTLIFRETNLAAALVELNRYLPQPVDTSDPSLGNLNVSGTFSLEEPEATLAAIIQAFELQSYRNPFDNKRRLYLR